MEKNNLFSYATSELSQDAFICWLLNWANPKYKNDKDIALHNCGVDFLNAFFEKCDIDKPQSYKQIEIEKQFKKIDVIVVVNNKYVIIIEDKTNTKNHSKQLQKYVAVIEKNKGISIIPKEYKLLKIYFKTGNQSNLYDVESKGYKTFMRKDFLKILKDNSKKIDNDIFKDYYDYLQNIEDRTNNLSKKNKDKWGWGRYEWQGFYMKLQNKLNFQKDKEGEIWEGQWKYVANPSGGFMGFWWHWIDIIDIDDGGIYMQLEQNKFCFKVMVDVKKKRSEIRNLWHSKIMETCNGKSINVIKPPRFGNGKYMTVAVLDGDYRCTKDDGKIDMEKTIKQLNELENILEETINKNS